MPNFSKVQEEINDFDSKNSKFVEDLLEKSEKLSKACGYIEQSWSGSYAGWHGRMYFKDFDKPTIYEKFNGEWGGINGIPDGWEEKNNKQMQDKILEITGGVSVEDFEKQAELFCSSLKELKENIVLYGNTDDNPLSEQGKKYLQEIESYIFGQTRVDYANSNLSKQLMSRDTEAIRQGMTIPGWLYYASVAYEAKSAVEAYQEFKKKVERFLKTANLSLPLKAKVTINPDLHPEVIAKCSSLYDSRAYAEAVEKSFKIVKDKLRSLTGFEKGSEAFGKGKLHIKGAAAPNVDDDFNEAAKFLTMAIDMFRNEKSHTSDAKIVDPIRAHQYLVMSSLALTLLENSEIKP